MAAHGSQMIHSGGMMPAMSTLSMREKSQLKRRINREHNCNFRAGYIEVNEEYLHKTGIRGRKRYLLYCVVFTLIFLALVNALATAGLVYFLGISHLGINDLEFLLKDDLLRVFADTEITKIKMFDAGVGGRFDKNLKIVGMEGSVVIQAPWDNGTRVVLFDKKITITSDNFQVSSLKDDRVFMSTSKKSSYPLKKSRNLHAAGVQADIVRSGTEYPDLDIESYNRILISGSEGVTINSQQGLVSMTANQNIKLNSTAGSVNFEPMKHFYMSKQLPISSSKYDQVQLNSTISQSNSSTDNSSSQSDASIQFSQSEQAYKLCFCMSTGKLFAVKVTDSLIGCKNFQSDFNPCS
ncbi:hypothetical protein LOTGIDRAFT_234314 [Lottia gigantea]|uniref:Beta-sarcoglycan n=1 Tax=Lottia gigantea TaxID=225164 RepID=V4A3G7_LOTGI|nr:hypothetical protein LOTGIDRAFT_234314 [Lottia gigantea]ESO89480.1 hypothetical protein LOTGIDRAFT_234314 [Lottia gigantea]